MKWEVILVNFALLSVGSLAYVSGYGGAVAYTKVQTNMYDRMSMMSPKYFPRITNVFILNQLYHQVRL